MKTWTTQTGEKIAIKDMTTEHILNCIRMLEKHLASRPGESVYMGDSEFAEAAVEQESRHNEQIAEEIEKRIVTFKRELKKRAIT